MTIGSVGGYTSAILSPVCVPVSWEDINMIIARHDKTKYYLNFNTNIAKDGYLNVVACCDAYDKNNRPISNIIYMLCVYIPKDSPNDNFYKFGLFEFDYTTLSTVANTPTEVINAKAETQLYPIGNFNQFMKFMNCGKETYKCYYLDDGVDVGVWFVGSYLFYFNDDYADCVAAPAWKLDDNNYLYKNKDNNNYYTYNMTTVASSPETLREAFDRFYNSGGFDIIDNDNIHVSDISPPYLLKDFSTNAIMGIVQNP